jgi:hypothetical protein
VTIENNSTGNPVHIRASGGDASVGLHLVAKGASGYVNVTDGVDETKRIMFNASGSTTNTRTMLSSTQTVDRTLSLPDATDTLVGKATTDTLTNKTITGGILNGTLGATTPSTIAGTTGTFSGLISGAVGALFNGNVSTTDTAAVALKIGNMGGTAPANQINAYIGAGVGGVLGAQNGDLIYVPRTSSAGNFGHRFFSETAGVATQRVLIDNAGLAITGALSCTTGANFATSSGNVGIGTGSPLGKFGVASALGVVGFNFGTSSSPERGNLWYDTDGTGWKFNIGKLVGSTFTSQMTFVDSGNVGIGTTSPAFPLDVNLGLVVRGNATRSGSGMFLANDSTYGYSINAVNPSVVGLPLAIMGYPIKFLSSDTGGELARIDTSGNVGIGTVTAAAKLDVRTSTSGEVTVGTFSNDSTAAGTNSVTLAFASSGVTKASISSAVYGNGYMAFRTNDNTEKMRIDASGNVGIGTDTPVGRLGIQSAASTNAYIEVAGNGNTLGSTSMLFGQNSTSVGYCWNRANANLLFGTNGTERMSISAAGAVAVVGALSKGSGSFRIEHPLPEKSATHQLVHSFIEGPKCDLIYRGKINLVDGKASVNIDTDSTMTEGTFEVLCANVQCFTSNESGWGAIRGKVVGNILTIEAQDAASTDNVSWMVIGERKDPHIMDTDWTDKNGRPIVEPLKPAEPALESK